MVLYHIMKPDTGIEYAICLPKSISISCQSAGKKNGGGYAKGDYCTQAFPNKRPMLVDDEKNLTKEEMKGVCRCPLMSL